MSKITYDNQKSITFKKKDQVIAAYIPQITITDELREGLKTVPFCRVHYISRFGKPNRTPRLTWAYGKVEGQSSETSYKGLNFEAETMPEWLNNLSLQCRKISKERFGFDPEYNSAIIGCYRDGSDQIGFHFDTESFLKHHFCANVTIGDARDFQFRTVNSKNERKTHEIKLADGSVFFFLGLEHALPKRAKTANGSVRYSISFRNMKNNIGIGNSFYYCRGVDGAIDDEDKESYIEKLKSLQDAKSQ